MMICFASSAVLLAINRYAFVDLGGGQRGEVYLLVPDTAMSVVEEALYTSNVGLVRSFHRGWYVLTDYAV